MERKNPFLEISYNDAVSLINSGKIEENHNILDCTINDIEDSTLTCEIPETELSPMRSQVFYIIPDILIYAKEEKFIQLKKEIDLYKNDFESICGRINNLVGKMNKDLKDLVEPSTKLKGEIKNIIAKFEENIKNLCIPLISEKEGLKTININNLNEEQKKKFNEDKLSVNNVIKEFKEETENLNNKYQFLFNQIRKDIQLICNNIKEIPSSINILQDKVEEEMTIFEGFLEEFNDPNDYENYHKYFSKLKDSIQLIQEKLDNLIEENKKKMNNLNCGINKREKKFENLKNEVNSNINILKGKSNSIKDYIIEIRKKNNEKQIEIPSIIISEIEIKPITASMEESKKKIESINNSISEYCNDLKQEITQFDKKTSLDLLFIIDITGSMEPYVDQIKINLIKIMNEIEKKCLGNDINLGFIGYKDVEEISNNDYSFISLTREHNKVKEEINNIVVDGGDDEAEHIAWAFEKALFDQKWESNAKLSILITDAPCHGAKYHTKSLVDFYPQGVPNSMDIEELVTKMAKLQISLFCIKINKKTDIMYNIFENIYKNENELLFKIISLDSPNHLIDIVIKSASTVYNNQRFNNSVCLI